MADQDIITLLKNPMIFGLLMLILGYVFNITILFYIGILALGFYTLTIISPNLKDITKMFQRGGETNGKRKK